jgi:hypothetical protein
MELMVYGIPLLVAIALYQGLVQGWETIMKQKYLNMYSIVTRRLNITVMVFVVESHPPKI